MLVSLYVVEGRKDSEQVSGRRRDRRRRDAQPAIPPSHHFAILPFRHFSISPSRHLAISLTMQAIGQCLPRGALALVWVGVGLVADVAVCARGMPSVETQMSRHPPSCMHVPMSPSWTNLPPCSLIRGNLTAGGKATGRGSASCHIPGETRESIIIPQAGASTIWCRVYAPIARSIDAQMVGFVSTSMDVTSMDISSTEATVGIIRRALVHSSYIAQQHSCL